MPSVRPALSRLAPPPQASQLRFVPLPAVTARQMEDVRPDPDAPVGNDLGSQLRQLHEILVIPVDKPELRPHPVQHRADSVEVTPACCSRPDPEIAEVQNNAHLLIRQQLGDPVEYVQRPVTITVPVPRGKDTPGGRARGRHWQSLVLRHG